MNLLARLSEWLRRLRRRRQALEPERAGGDDEEGGWKQVQLRDLGEEFRERDERLDEDV